MVALGLVGALGLGASALAGCGSGDRNEEATAGGDSGCSGGDDLVVLSDGFNGEATVEAIDPGATELRRLSGEETTTKPSLSPDGRSVVVVHAEGDYESAGPDSTALWVLDVADGDVLRELTDGGSSVDEPAWSPDGRTIAFTQHGEGEARLMVVDASGGTPEELVASTGGGDYLPTWSPDGSRVAFVRNGEAAPADAPPPAELWTVAADGSDPARVADLDRWASSVTWNPDGGSLLVGADREGLFEVALAADGTGAVTKVADSGSLPTWSRDGRRLYLVQELSDPGAEATPTGPGDSQDSSAGRYWAVLEARYEDRQVVPVREIHDYPFLYGYHGLTVGPCRPEMVPTTAPPTGLPAPSTTSTTPMDEASPTCAAAGAFAQSVASAPVDDDDPTPSPSPAYLADLSDLTLRGTLTGEVDVVAARSPDPAQIGIELVVVDPLVPDGGAEPGALVVLLVPDPGGVSSSVLDGVDLRGTPVVVSAFVSVRRDDDPRVHLVLGREGAATACDGEPPIGRLGTGPGWLGLSSLDDLAAATRG